jgi:hypothetical protein
LPQVGAVRTHRIPAHPDDARDRAKNDRQGSRGFVPAASPVIHGFVLDTDGVGLDEVHAEDPPQELLTQRHLIYSGR